MNITPFTAKFFRNKIGWGFNVYLDGRLFSANPMNEEPTRNGAKSALNKWCESNGKSVIIL